MDHSAQEKKTVDVSKGGKRIIWICVVCFLFVFAIAFLFDSGYQAEPESEYSKEDYMAMCQEFDYKELVRYSENNENKMMKIYGQVQQILKENGRTVYRVYTKDKYGFYAEDTFCVIDDRAPDSVRILEDDVVAIYGEYKGLTTWEYAISKTEVEVPTIYAKFIDIEN